MSQQKKDLIIVEYQNIFYFYACLSIKQEVEINWC